MHDSNVERQSRHTLSRRRFAGLGTGLTASLLAGSPLIGQAGRVVMAQDGTTEFHVGMPYLDPGAGGHFNNFVTNGIMNPPNMYGDLMFIPMGLLYWSNNEWLPLLATDWHFSVGADTASPAADAATPAAVDLASDTFNVTLREGVNWSDGQPVTSQDVIDTFDCLWLMSNTVWKYIDEVTAVDDLHLSFHMSTPSTIVERYVIRRSPMPSAVYGEYAQKARDLRTAGKTSDDPEFKQLLDQFNKYRPEDLIVNGPYTIDKSSITNAQLTMPKNDTSFWAEQGTFDKIISFNGETDTITAVVLSKDIDYATHGFPPATEKQLIEEGFRLLRPPNYSGAMLMFNFGTNPEFTTEVRQALAHAMDRHVAGVVSLGESGVAVKYMTGMSDNFVPQWMPEEAIAALNPYEYDVDKATELLTAAGWTKDGDTWKKPDGSTAEYEVIWPAEYSDWAATGSNVVEQLQTFGFKMTGRPITYTQIGTDIDQGKFQLAIEGWGSSSNPHPAFSFQTAFYSHNTLALNNGGKGTQFPLEQDTKVAGHVDLNQLTIDSALGMDEAKQKEEVTIIAQVFNELLNVIPLWERYGNDPILEGVRMKPWPPDDDKIMKNSPYADGYPTMLMLTGLLQPV